MTRNLWRRRAALLASCAIVTTLAGATLAPRPAQAFVCDSTTPGGADGATAAGGAVACGTAATASGTDSVAVGNASTASGAGCHHS